MTNKHVDEDEFEWAKASLAGKATAAGQEAHTAFYTAWKFSAAREHIKKENTT